VSDDSLTIKTMQFSNPLNCIFIGLHKTGDSVRRVKSNVWMESLNYLYFYLIHV